MELISYTRDKIKKDQHKLTFVCLTRVLLRPAATLDLIYMARKIRSAGLIRLQPVQIRCRVSFCEDAASEGSCTSMGSKATTPGGVREPPAQ